MMTKKIGLSKTRPQSEARPLGTPTPKRGRTSKPTATPTATPIDDDGINWAAGPAVLAETISPVLEKTSINAPTDVVHSDHTAAIPPQDTEMHMTTLTLKSLNKKGTVAYYIGAPQSMRFPIANFPDKVAPPTIDLPSDIFVAKAPKRVLTAEERKAARAARPKLTIAERASKLRARLAKLDAQAKAEAEAGQLTM